jgi:peptide/nickel transport system ATP-binding protein
MSTPLTPRLSVRGLSTSFMTDRGRVTSVSDVSFDIPSGGTLALVGESGSGKSVTSLGLMGLHAKGSQAIVGGEAWFVRRDGQRVDLLSLAEPDKRRLRGNELAMIFQEPMTSLNPVLTVGEQIAESARLHLGMDRKQAMQHAKKMLDLVEIPAAERRVHEYPHQLSGGMRQRVMIALAMACNPTLLIADEPTTALDVTIQAQILALIQRLQKETGMSVLFITHNLGVVAQYADQVTVMYAGRIVETAAVGPLFATPQHPYTRGLLACLPGMAARGAAGRQTKTRPRLTAISGQVCSPFEPPPGCAFAPRCPLHFRECDTAMPPLQALSNDRKARCIRVKENELKQPRHSGLDPESRGAPLDPGVRRDDGETNDSTLIERWHERQR